MTVKPIFVLNGAGYYKAVEKLGPMCTLIKDFVKNPTQFQFVLFTGGEDIAPSLYGDKSPLGFCMYSNYRDSIEQIVYKIALKNKIKMVGICRGLQFLTAMAGGKLLHHVENHVGNDHVMYLNFPWEEKKAILVNSYHHQMALPTKEGIVLGHAPKSIAKNYYGDEDKQVDWEGEDVEAMYLPNINAFGVQWHPEALKSTSDGYCWFNTMVDLFINDEKGFINHITKQTEAGA